MSLDAALGLATRCVERGWVPDPLVRWGIRRVCAQRLADARAAMGSEPAEMALGRFIDAMADAPIALVPGAANAQHYEVPAACFAIMLGPQLKYSSCWWGDADSPIATLADAEEKALAVTASRAQMEDGMRVLELGCGWGSLSLWLASRYRAAHITAVSNSASQRAFIEARARERGLTNLSVVTADVNTLALDTRFDRVVSVEMFEHMRNYPALLRRIHGWLHPDGLLFVHVFCHERFAYAYETDGAANWMGRHFFTGGLMPSLDLLPSVSSPFHLEQQWTWDGTHYRRTADAWLRQLDAHRDEMVAIFARTHVRHDARLRVQRWRMFLMAVSELFGYGEGREWGVAHYAFRPAG